MSVFVGLVLLLSAFATSPRLESCQSDVVRAVFFFSPTCPHCRAVLEQQLPIIFAAFGGRPQLRLDETTPPAERGFYLWGNGRIEILLVDASQPAGNRLYQASTKSHRIPANRLGVPRLLVGDSALVGEREIPLAFPGLIVEALADGGQDWPPIPGVAEALAAVEGRVVSGGGVDRAPGDTVQPAAPAPSPPGAWAGMVHKLVRDPIGNTLSVLILVGMVMSVGLLALLPRVPDSRREIGAAFPLVAAVGFGAAAYLTYIEWSGDLAVCGPVGDCHTVQQSRYAVLFGVIPVAALGLAGYMIMAVLWMVSKAPFDRAANWAKLSIFGMTVAGTLFSIYLTFLEPFVIGATCAWCLTSAVATTVLMWLSAGPARSAWAAIGGRHLPPRT